MVNVARCDSPISLDDLSGRIRKSSNFRFSWQFYQCGRVDLQWPANIQQALEAIIATAELHEFLRESFEPVYAQEFEVVQLHEHCRVDTAAGDFENILARAAGDHLGAYSQQLRDASISEKQEIKGLFGCLGEYRTFELLPGSNSECRVCQNSNNHLFSSWFYGVAWDWCLIAAWPRSDLLWVGCLTDTD